MYKFYGDEFLSLRDLFNRMTTNEAISCQMVSKIPLFPFNELPYLSGEKELYKREIGFFMGITRVIANDHTGKYKKLIESRTRLKFNIPQEILKPTEYDYVR